MNTPDTESERAQVAYVRETSNVTPIRPDIDVDAPEHFERGDQSELAGATLRALGPYPLTFDAGEFWRYAPARGIWELIPSHLVRSTAETFAGCPAGLKMTPIKISASTTAGAEALARDRLLSSPRRVVFDGAPVGIAFANGFVTVVGGQISLLEHAADHRARFCYPFPYDRSAARPALESFLGELFGDCDLLERLQRMALLQEFAGVCLIGDATRYQRALFLYGPGGNGKSEALRILRGIFPPGSTSAIPPQRWGERFRLAQLEGKLANFVDEIPEGEILAGEAFKAVVTGEPNTGERKHKDPFDFIPRAGHIFSANAPIATADHSDGFWRRPLVLPFTRRFDTAPGRKLEAGLAVLEAELPAVVAWAIEGAARAQEQGGYTIPGSSTRTAAEWRDDSDQVRLFASEQPITEKCAASEMYERYKTWGKVNGFALMSSTKFGRRLMGTGFYERTDEAAGRFYTRRGQR